MTMNIFNRVVITVIKQLKNIVFVHIHIHSCTYEFNMAHSVKYLQKTYTYLSRTVYNR